MYLRTEKANKWLTPSILRLQTRRNGHETVLFLLEILNLDSKVYKEKIYTQTPRQRERELSQSSRFIWMYPKSWHMLKIAKKRENETCNLCFDSRRPKGDIIREAYTLSIRIEDIQRAYICPARGQRRETCKAANVSWALGGQKNRHGAVRMSFLDHIHSEQRKEMNSDRWHFEDSEAPRQT